MHKFVSILIASFITIFNMYGNDSIDVNRTVLSSAYPNKFTGVSSMTMYEHVSSTFDSSSQTYTTDIFDTIYNFIKPLNIKVFRFPGGTIGNYYHFYGKGHGIDTSETMCAPGRAGASSFANQHLPFDRRVDKNMIEYFKEEMDTLKKYGNDIGISFRVNSHTHFYKGDLKRHSDSIQYLIYKYMGNDTAILNTNGNTLDSNRINSIVTKMMQLQTDAVYSRIKRYLINDTGFSYRFRENMDAVAYLRNNGISILGAEIGNETYAEYVVFDDDLDYLGFDCTQIPDSFSFNLWDLPLRYYLEGMIKNNILVSLYADSLRIRYNIYSAVPANSGFNYLSLDSQYEPIHIKPYDLSVKKSDLWNKYYSSQPNVFALIPHIYAQSFLDCNNYMQSEALYGIDQPTANRIAEKFFTFFIDTFLIYNLQRYNYYGSNKPLWITEWNFSDNSFANNTFMHAFYNYYFIRKAVEIHDFSANYIQVLLYHHLSGASHTWPLIRASITGQGLSAERQITYSPFYIWSNTFNKQVKKLKTPFWQTNQHTFIDAFIDNTKREVIIQFANTDSVNHFIDLNDLTIHDDAQKLIPEKIDRYLLDAENYTSTNYTICSFFNNPSYNNNYTVTEDTLSQKDTLWMPSLSMGKFTLHVKEQIPTSIINPPKSKLFRIFPNPAQQTLSIQFNTSQYQSPCTYTIVDGVGKPIINGKLKDADTIVNIESLTKGWYLIQLEINNQIIDYQNFVKI